MYIVRIDNLFEISAGGHSLRIHWLAGRFFMLFIGPITRGLPPPEGVAFFYSGKEYVERDFFTLAFSLAGRVLRILTTAQLRPVLFFYN